MIRRISTLAIYALTNRNFATPPVEIRLMKVVGEFRRYVSPEARYDRYRKTLPAPKPALWGIKSRTAA